jgi:CBS domain-containing protein
MNIRTICSRVVASAAETESVKAGALRMAEYGVGTLVMVNENRHPVGIVTDRDVMLRCVAEGKDPVDTPLSEIMTSPVRTLHEMSPMDEALDAMQKVAARRLVITDDDGAVVGILSIDDVIGLVSEQLSRVGTVLRTQRREVLGA